MSNAISSVAGTKPPAARAQLRVVSKRGTNPGVPQRAQAARATPISWA